MIRPKAKLNNLLAKDRRAETPLNCIRKELMGEKEIASLNNLQHGTAPQRYEAAEQLAECVSRSKGEQREKLVKKLTLVADRDPSPHVRFAARQAVQNAEPETPRRQPSEFSNWLAVAKHF
jgi:hypothetical protein